MLLYLFVFVSFGISNVILNRVYHCSSSSALNYSEIFRCHNGIDCIDIKHLCDGIVDCADGSDESHCSNTKASPKGVCILPQYPLHGTYTVLDEPDALPGAAYKFVELSMTCDKGYGVIESDGSVSSNDVHEIICVNGKWSSRIPECVKYTPLDKESVQPMDVIPPTKRVTREISPWFVDIYGEDFSFPLCSGTIITSQVVFTSAYCMEGYYASNVTFTVIAGKLHRTFTDVEGLQNVTVAHSSTYNKDNIPISHRLFFLKLLRPLIFNSYVKPAIIDFDQALEDSQLQPGSVGKVIGWHSTTDERSYIDYPYEHLDSDVLKLFTPENELPTVESNICGGVKADSDQEPYNAGSGYVFTDKSTGTERHYLRGVVSYGVPCWHNACPYGSYIIFVKISYHKNSISQYLKVHNQTASYP